MATSTFEEGAMKSIRTGVAALFIASMLSTTIASGTASAQTATPAATPSRGLDGYWLLAVGTGVVAGIVVATVLTDGVILPVYAWATAAEGGGGMLAGGMGGARAGMGGMAAGEGAAVAAGAAEGAAAGEGAAMAAGGARAGMAGGMATQNSFMWSGTMLFRRGMQTLGAITGGLVGDDLYGG
jgi:hypothetical protein